MTVIAGLRGALKGLVAFVASVAIVAALPSALTSLANRGTIDLDAFVPRAAVSPPQAGHLQVEGSPREAAAVRQALNDLVWPVDTSALKVVVTAPQSLPSGDAGVYLYPDNVIYLNQKVVDEPAKFGLSHVLAHEVGHMVDMVYLDDAGRAEFLRLRGYGPNVDWTGENDDWKKRPSEDFAEVFAALSAPSSSVAIQTDGGPIKDPTAMSSLLQRYQPGPTRKVNSLKVATMLSLARAGAHEMTTDWGDIRMLFGLAVVCAVVSAVDSMEDVPYRLRARHLKTSRMKQHRVRPGPA